MKKLLFVALSATFLFSCSDGKIDGYSVKGTIDAVEDGEQVFIEVPSEMGGVVAIDTAVVKNGTFEFVGKAEEIKLAYIQIGTLQWKVPFVLENEKITVTAYKDSLQTSKAGGSYNNEELTKFNANFDKISAKIDKFNKENMAEITTARQNNDTEALEKLEKEYKALEGEVRGYMESYASENPKAFVSLMLLSHLSNNPDTDFEKLKASAEALAPELKSTKIGKELEEKLKNLSATAIGQTAPDFSAPNPDGQMVSLKESLGKVTLIDFWASWCGPCRRENPNVVALYNEFHEKGFNIIGVSLDRPNEKDKWLEAIATDKLTWTQISNLQYWQDPIAKQYNVRSIPATFLLDESGKIIAKDLRGAELRAKVAEALGE